MRLHLTCAAWRCLPDGQGGTRPKGLPARSDRKARSACNRSGQSGGGCEARRAQGKTGDSRTPARRRSSDRLFRGCSTCPPHSDTFRVPAQLCPTTNRDRRVENAVPGQFLPRLPGLHSLDNTARILIPLDDSFRKSFRSACRQWESESYCEFMTDATEVG